VIKNQQPRLHPGRNFSEFVRGRVVVAVVLLPKLIASRKARDRVDLVKQDIRALRKFLDIRIGRGISGDDDDTVRRREAIAIGTFPVTMTNAKRLDLDIFVAVNQPRLYFMGTLAGSKPSTR
jgi:hypothetical protein